MIVTFTYRKKSGKLSGETTFRNVVQVERLGNLIHIYGADNSQALVAPGWAHVVITPEDR